MVRGVVDLDAQIEQAAADVAAQVHLVFADAGRKDEAVEAAEGRDVGADKLHDLVNEHLMRQNGARVALDLTLCDVAVVARQAGHAEHAGFLIEDAVHLFGA